jgi:hypothetical protein
MYELKSLRYKAKGARKQTQQKVYIDRVLMQILSKNTGDSHVFHISAKYY